MNKNFKKHWFVAIVILLACISCQDDNERVITLSTNQIELWNGDSAIIDIVGDYEGKLTLYNEDTVICHAYTEHARLHIMTQNPGKATLVLRDDKGARASIRIVSLEPRGTFEEFSSQILPAIQDSVLWRKIYNEYVCKKFPTLYIFNADYGSNDHCLDLRIDQVYYEDFDYDYKDKKVSFCTDTDTYSITLVPYNTVGFKTCYDISEDMKRLYPQLGMESATLTMNFYQITPKPAPLNK